MVTDRVNCQVYIVLIYKQITAHRDLKQNSLDLAQSTNLRAQKPLATTSTLSSTTAQYVLQSDTISRDRQARVATSMASSREPPA